MSDKRYRAVAHDQLLSALTSSAHKHARFPPVLATIMRARVDEEKARRNSAKDEVGQETRMEGTL